MDMRWGTLVLARHGGVAADFLLLPEDVYHVLFHLRVDLLGEGYDLVLSLLFLLLGLLLQQVVDIGPVLLHHLLLLLLLLYGHIRFLKSSQ